MSFKELNGESQGTVLVWAFGLGTVLYGGAYFISEIVQNIANVGWYVAVPLWIACMFASYPLAFGAAKASTTCEKCNTPWAKHSTGEEEILQVFPRTQKSGDTLVHYEVTRYRTFCECNQCGHRTQKDRERSRELYRA